jgi:formylglycine-generating enzyme required for sulfatase activity
MGRRRSGNSDRRSAGNVTVSSFYMSIYPITQREWFEVMGTTIQQQRDMVNRSLPLRGEGDNFPMYYVSWFEAIEYCNKRSIREGLMPVYQGSSGTNITVDWTANGYRLPTEAEWEFAAKDENNVFVITEFSGSNNIDVVAWFSGNSGERTHPVGTKAPNTLGLYDMSGNVWEWCWDWYGTYPSGARTDPRGASAGFRRVIRGGSWYDSAANARSANRDFSAPFFRRSNVGFRLVRNAQ